MSLRSLDQFVTDQSCGHLSTNRPYTHRTASCCSNVWQFPCRTMRSWLQVVLRLESFQSAPLGILGICCRRSANSAEADFLSTDGLRPWAPPAVPIAHDTTSARAHYAHFVSPSHPTTEVGHDFSPDPRRP